MVSSLVGTAIDIHLREYSQKFRRSGVKPDDKAFRSYLERKGLTAKTPPSPSSREERVLDNLSRLAPDWKRRFKMGSVRLKTLLRIYLSKWFFDGLEWQEIMLLDDLLRREKLSLDIFSEPLNLKRRGCDVLVQMVQEDEKKPFNLQGWEFLELDQLLPLIFDEVDYRAVWKLRSVQALRDFIFVPFANNHEHEGKQGIRKPRIRGYRDGKGSARDPLLTKMARQLDVLFYEQRFEARWSELSEELEAMTKT